MKTTIKFLAALTFVLIFAAVNNANAQLWNPTVYKVRINYVSNPLGFSGNYFIGVVNDRGHLVAPAQLFRYGTWDYVFTENNLPLGNTRTAMMDIGPHSNSIGGYVVSPMTLYGPFKQGWVYYFQLTPLPQGVPTK